MTAAALHERLGRYLWVGGLSRDALEASSDGGGAAARRRAARRARARPRRARRTC